MSSFLRGVLDGVVHYCDGGYWTRPEDKGIRRNLLLPWCAIKGEYRFAKPANPKKALVTCLRCIGHRRRR